MDFEANTIRINKQLQRERVKGSQHRLVSLKNDKERKVAPASFVMDLLKVQQQKQRVERMKAGEAWENHLNLVFTNGIGRNLSPNTVYTNFKALVGSFGSEATRFHDLRHSFAVLSLQNGDDIKTVQNALGHHTAAFTLDMYGHVSEKMQRESAARMDAYIQGLKTTKLKL